MKVGDLVEDSHYGGGIILKIEGREYTIFFYEVDKTGVLDEHLIEEVVSESR